MTESDFAEVADISERPPSSNLQSVERAFNLLEIAATNGGAIGVSQLAARSGMPMPTIHRVVRTLVNLGYLRQEPSRLYALGPRLLLLAEGSSTMLHNLATPHLTDVVDAIGESANMAMLDGDQIAYIAQVPGRHSMRMFTEVGRRVSPHCTAVGKAVLSLSDPDAVQQLLRRTGMPRHTDTTITDPTAYAAELDDIRARGYALDEGEQEVGVRCVAVAIPQVAGGMAISISGPTGRVTDELVAHAVPVLQSAARRLADELS